MIDIVVTKPLTDQFLEKIGLFIGAFGGPEARNTGAANVFHPFGGYLQCLVPCRLAEVGLPVAGVDVQTLGRRIIAADQGPGQAVFVVDIVKPETPFDTKPPFVGRTVDTLDKLDLVVLDLERNLTADPTERADAFDLAVIVAGVAQLVFVRHGRRQKRPCRAGLHTFAASHTG